MSHAEREGIVDLEGRPIHDGDTLWGLDGEEYTARPNTRGRYTEYPLLLEVKSSYRNGGVKKDWFTDTHYMGTQVLFWNPPTEKQIDAWYEEEQSSKVLPITDPDLYLHREA